MRFFNWLCDCWKSFWGKVFFIGALLFCVMILCWIIGWQCNLLVVGAFLLGLWAVRTVAKRINPGISVKELLKDIYWYIAIFVCTAGFFLTFFKSSLLFMYLDWSTAHQGIAGFAQIFAPIIVLTVAAVALATIAQTRKFTIFWVWFCLISSAIGLMGFRLVRPLDQFGGAKQEQMAEVLDASRMNMERDLGLRAVIINSEAAIYDSKDSRKGFFSPFMCDPNGAEFEYSAGTVLPVNDKKLITATGTGSVDKFVEVKIAGEVRWFNAKDVKVLAGADVEEGEGYQILKESGSQWTIYLWTDEPIKLDWQGITIASYQEAIDGTYPEVNMGRGYTKLDNGIAINTTKGSILLRWKGGIGKKITLIFRRT